MSDVDNYDSILTFVISIISVITLLIGIIQWKMRNILRAHNFQITTNHDLVKLTERLDELVQEDSENERQGGRRDNPKQGRTRTDAKRTL